MKVCVRSLSVQKRGNQPHENEDAFWPHSPGGWLAPHIRFAIADGATESIFSRLWARLLVSTYCSIHTPLPDSNALTPFQERTQKAAQHWAKRVTALPLPWHALAKLQKGAFASLLGLTLERGEGAGSGPWHAFAVGDSCLFHLRQGELLTYGPIQHPDQFGYHPGLIATDPAKNKGIWDGEERWFHRGQWHSGDIFALMTDALAYWFLVKYIEEQNPWPLLTQFEEIPANFYRWVDTERDAGALRNDDTTMLLIHIAAAEYQAKDESL